MSRAGMACPRARRQTPTRVHTRALRPAHYLPRMAEQSEIPVLIAVDGDRVDSQTRACCFTWPPCAVLDGVQYLGTIDSRYARNGSRASPNGVPSESLQIAQRSPGWTTLPPSACTLSSVSATSLTVK